MYDLIKKVKRKGKTNILLNMKIRKNFALLNQSSRLIGLGSNTKNYIPIFFRIETKKIVIIMDP